MAAMHDRIFQDGLNIVDTEVTHLRLLSASRDDLNFSAVTGVTLGTKTTPAVIAATDRGAGGGMKITISAITDGTVSGTGTATHFALTDDNESDVLVAGAISAPQVVTSGNIFTLTEFTVGIPDPV